MTGWVSCKGRRHLGGATGPGSSGGLGGGRVDEEGVSNAGDVG